MIFTSLVAFDWPNGNHRPLPLDADFLVIDGKERLELLEGDGDSAGAARGVEGPAPLSGTGGANEDEELGYSYAGGASSGVRSSGSGSLSRIILQNANLGVLCAGYGGKESLRT